MTWNARFNLSDKRVTHIVQCHCETTQIFNFLLRKPRLGSLWRPQGARSAVTFHILFWRRGQSMLFRPPRPRFEVASFMTENCPRPRAKRRLHQIVDQIFHNLKKLIRLWLVFLYFGEAAGETSQQYHIGQVLVGKAHKADLVDDELYLEIEWPTFISLRWCAARIISWRFRFSLDLELDDNNLESWSCSTMKTELDHRRQQLVRVFQSKSSIGNI